MHQRRPSRTRCRNPSLVTSHLPSAGSCAVQRSVSLIQTKLLPSFGPFVVDAIQAAVGAGSPRRAGSGNSPYLKNGPHRPWRAVQALLRHY